jgi:hypothetical protein
VVLSGLSSFAGIPIDEQALPAPPKLHMTSKIGLVTQAVYQLQSCSFSRGAGRIVEGSSEQVRIE